MKLKSRTSSLVVVGVVGLLSPFALHALAQDQAPNRREITLTARNYRFNPARIEVSQDDLVKLTVQSEDNAYSVTIDEYPSHAVCPLAARQRSSFAPTGPVRLRSIPI